MATLGRALGLAGAACGLAAVGYATYVARTWSRYGRPLRGRPDDQDELLDRFMPVFDVVERHRIAVRAPAAATLAVARDMKLSSLPIVRAIFKGRELLLRAEPDRRQQPPGLIAEVLSLGWVILAELPEREVVVGAVTKPWEPNVTFRSVAPDAFAAFDEPGYVKIAWTLRADPTKTGSIFRTETRAVATDSFARAMFRWYWSLLSPGIMLIRRLSLGPVKKEAERAHCDTASSIGTAGRRAKAALIRRGSTRAELPS
jgi:hypothetical protein